MLSCLLGFQVIEFNNPLNLTPLTHPIPQLHNWPIHKLQNIILHLILIHPPPPLLWMIRPPASFPLLLCLSNIILKQHMRNRKLNSDVRHTLSDTIHGSDEEGAEC